MAPQFRRIGFVVMLGALVPGACNSASEDRPDGGGSGGEREGGSGGGSRSGGFGGIVAGSGGSGGTSGSSSGGTSGGAGGSGGAAAGAGSGGGVAGATGGGGAGGGPMAGSAAGGGGSAGAGGTGGTAGPLPKNRLFLMLGQSNMSGYGMVEDVDRQPVARAFKMNQAKAWSACTEPVGIFSATVGPSRAFAAQLIAKETVADAQVYVINAAVSGSSIESWAPAGGENYNQMLPFLDEGLKTAQLVGIIWHQGEANGGTAVEEYKRRLREIIAAIRTRANSPNAIFVAGEVGTESSQDDVNRNPNQATRQLAMTDRLCGFVSSAGTTTMPPDHVHYDSASQRLLGGRYADKWRELVPMR